MVAYSIYYCNIIKIVCQVFDLVVVPFDELRQALANAKKVIVLDRSISIGGPGGPFASEVRAALYDLASRPAIVGFIGGLGGRDILPEHFVELIKKGKAMGSAGQEKYEMYGVRSA